MVFENNTQRVLAFFFTFPSRTIHLRELSRTMKLTMPAILNAVRKLEQEALVTVERQRAWTFLSANRTERFNRLKRLFNIEQLYESGFVDTVRKEFHHPQAIICFGSFSRGEDDEQSDIDIAILRGRTGSLPKTFAQLLRRKVSLHHPRMERVSQEFRENLRNGIILDGAW